ncbi:hypothetical protein [Actinoplanes sp. NPDC051851]|uniref:hypothetical protein n=1 Tax=Actinoplanes sp. NPDC051851 TaxID=3154753 RepID=UPI0034496CA8
MPPATYRHLPWLGWSSFLLLIFGSGAVRMAATAISSPSINSVASAYTGLLLISPIIGFLALGFRVRTIVDDEAITQQWYLRAHRVPFTEITAVERDASSKRWFLRVHCGTETFEVIPCQLMVTAGGPFSPHPPKAMLAVEEAISQRRP